MAFSNIKETGRPVVIKDEGLSITDNVSEIDFAGAGVSGVATGDAVVETIISGGRTSKDVTPTGTINGSNTSFTLPDTPSTDSLHLYLNGVYQTPGGVDYSLSTNTITYVSAPPTGSAHRARYEV